MLKIRKEQQKVFAAREVQDFEDRMWGHLGVLFPAYCATLGEAAVRRLIRHGIARAARYGIVSEKGLPWAAEILTARAVKSPHLRADLLFDTALEHLEEARGIRAEEAV
jgi:hypothetical protein